MSATALLATALVPSALRLNARLAEADLVVGRVVVPTLAKPWESRKAFRTARETLFAQGLYPGVDYEILERSEEERTVTVKPQYPLVAKLEREWPVTVDTALAPRCKRRRE